MLEVNVGGKDQRLRALLHVSLDLSNAVSQSVFTMQMEKERFVDAHPRWLVKVKS